MIFKEKYKIYDKIFLLLAKCSKEKEKLTLVLNNDSLKEKTDLFK